LPSHGQRADGPAARATLLVFTLGAVREALRHPLLPWRHRSEELRLRQACLESILAAGRRAGCRLEVSSPSSLDLAHDVHWSPQRGATFGERLRDAINAAFARSTGPVVVVGADIPGLAPRHVDAALSELDRDASAVVLGPSLDGGFYLLAATRPIDEALAAVAWCGPDARRSLTEALRARGRAVPLLERLADLDTQGDLDRWIRSTSAHTPVWNAWARRLSRVLATLKAPVAPGRPLLPSIEPVLTSPSRAPPAPATL
jgi:2-phospho-L-lactate guanylyltransferase (CobY/MobA/RfbA family)